MLFRFLIALLAFSVCIPSEASAAKMSVEDAYKFGHYRRTQFDPAKSTIDSKEDIKFLKELFQVSDNVVLSRIMVLDNIYTDKGRNAIDYTLDMTALINYMADVKAPEHLEDVKTLFLQLMDEQQDFMSHWAMATPPEKRKIEKTYASQPVVLNSGRLAHKIYIILMKEFPDESDHNKQAFIDHLYALDLGN